MVDASVSVGEVKMVVISKGFCVSEVLSGVFTVCKDVRKVRFSVVIEVLYSNIGVVVDGEVDFVVLVVSTGNCVLPLEVTEGVVVFSVDIKASVTMGVSVLEVRGEDTLTVEEVASVELMLVETGSTGRVLTLVSSLLEVDDRTGLKVDSDGISVVCVRSAKDSVGLLVVEVSGRVSERDIGLVYNVVEEVELWVILVALVVLSVEASGLGEELDVFNVVMVSTTPGLIGDDVSFSVLDMCAVGVEAVVLDSDTAEEVSDIETAGPIKVECSEEDVDDIAVLGGVNGGTTAGLMPKHKYNIY